MMMVIKLQTNYKKISTTLGTLLFSMWIQKLCATTSRDLSSFEGGEFLAIFLCAGFSVYVHCRYIYIPRASTWQVCWSNDHIVQAGRHWSHSQISTVQGVPFGLLWQRIHGTSARCHTRTLLVCEANSMVLHLPVDPDDLELLQWIYPLPQLPTKTKKQKNSRNTWWEEGKQIVEESTLFPIPKDSASWGFCFCTQFWETHKCTKPQKL